MTRPLRHSGSSPPHSSYLSCADFPMPGIFGLITKMPRAWAEPQLLRMLKVLRHESFYETGTWIDEQSGVYVGWTARENSFSAGMPLRNERGEVVLVFAGEEYSDPATVRQLREKGHEFAGWRIFLSGAPL